MHCIELQYDSVLFSDLLKYFIEYLRVAPFLLSLSHDVWSSTVSFFGDFSDPLCFLQFFLQLFLWDRFQDVLRLHQLVMNLGHSFFDDFLTNDHKVEGALQLAVLHCGVGGGICSCA